MAGLLKYLERVIKGGIFFVFAFMIVAVAVQIVGRTFMAQPPIWTEEGSRVALLYILGLGAGASVLTGDLVNVDLALMVMSKRVRRVCELISAALVSAFGFLLIPGAWTFTESGAMQTSPVLRVRMDFVFASTLCFAVLLAIFGLVKFIEVLLGVTDPELHKHQPGEV